ncbi:MAG: DNA translocase FtsK 4TM domain-containing protein [Butyrivibrio sp.]
MATAKNTKKKPNTSSAARKSTGPKKDTGKAGKQQKHSGIVREAVVLITLALSIIFFIANFGVGGTVGAAISSFFFGIFGLVAYIFPVLLFVGTIFLLSNKDNSVAWIKFTAAVCVMILLCTLIQLISGSHASEWKFSQYYTQSSLHKNGGGFLGGSLCKLFVTWFGTAGAYIIDIVFVIIGIVVISGKSFIAGVKKGSEKVYNTARNDMERHRVEVNARKVERREKERRERQVTEKVHGVTFNTEIVSEKSAAKAEKGLGNQDVHEISPEDDSSIYNFEKASDETEQSIPEDDYLRHYEEEQSSPLYNPEHEEEILPYDSKYEEEYREEYVDAGHGDAETGQIHNDSTVIDDSGYNAEGIDLDLVRKELDRDRAEAVSADKAEEPAHQKNDDVTVSNAAPRKRKPAKYVFPPLTLLKRGGGKKASVNQTELKSTAMKLQQTLANFGVKVAVTDVSCGPAVTRYEIQPEQGVKVSKIVSLADDIKLNLAAADIRIEAPIPGKAAVGIEVPNRETSGVLLGDLISSPEFKKNSSPIAFAAGKDIAGQTIVADIAKMPHLLIAGATGSGKSVCINTIIMSILYRARPDEVKLIMVDPKVVELSVYNGIPHLMIPVVTDPKKAAGALNWAVAEMTDRYQKFASYGVRDLKGYNEKVEQEGNGDAENAPTKLPQIVIIIDELADLMMVSSNEVEDAIVRLAQLARAAGIHLIIATQRPSVNVITGLIKANVPSRIAFSVSQGVDSRTIIDMNGAEKLLGKGDMLFYPQGYQKPARVQGAFVSDEEVAAVVEFLKEHCEETEYSEELDKQIRNPAFAESQTFGGDRDQYFGEAGRFIIEKQRASIGMLQRIYKIGFNRAARIMDQLCEAGVVGPEEGTKPRKVLMTMEEFEEYLRK